MKYTVCNLFPIDYWDMIVSCFIDVLHASQLGIRWYYGTQSLAKCHGFWFQENNTKWKGWQIEWLALVAVFSWESFFLLPSSSAHLNLIPKCKSTSNLCGIPLLQLTWEKSLENKWLSSCVTEAAVFLQNSASEAQTFHIIKYPEGTKCDIKLSSPHSNRLLQTQHLTNITNNFYEKAKGCFHRMWIYRSCPFQNWACSACNIGTSSPQPSVCQTSHNIMRLKWHHCHGLCPKL